MKKILIALVLGVSIFSCAPVNAAVINKNINSSYWNNFHTVITTKGVYASHIQLQSPASNNYLIGRYYIPAKTKIRIRSQIMGNSWVVSAPQLGIKNTSTSYWALPYNFKGFK